MTDSPAVSQTQQFDPDALKAFHAEIRGDWRGHPEFERLIRDAHLAIALLDAGRPLSPDIHPKVVALVEKHGPS